MDPIAYVAKTRFDAILATVWVQGTRRLTWERPGGALVEDLDERVWRANALHVRMRECPHWPEYRALAEPLVIEAARDQFVGQPDGVALELMFRQLQSQPSARVPVLRRVSENAALDHIVEAKVWPWLEQQSQQHRASGVTPSGLRLADTLARCSATLEAASIAAIEFREQIEPVAKLAYRWHELGIQISYLAGSAPHESDCVKRFLDDDGVFALTSCATILVQHSAYVRSCAVAARDTAVMTDRMRQTVADDDSHQWWADLTTRPITSTVRDEVTRITTISELAALLEALGEESDAAIEQTGDAFERMGWPREVACGTRSVGPTLRALARRLTT